MSTPERLLLPGEVAALFRVDPKTVTRWAKAGRLSAIRTLGGHRRYREADVHALLRGETSAANSQPETAIDPPPAAAVDLMKALKASVTRVRNRRLTEPTNPQPQP